ncbi:MAG: uracil-DNA glycosylase [Paracoccaceae bacterium]
MNNEPQEYHEALAQLAWQLELGVDEVIGATPVNRYEEAIKVKATRKVAVESSVKTTAEPLEAGDETALIAAACNDLDALHRAVKDFEGCALKRGARNTVFADGNPAARVMIIGEAPGRDEDIAGKPFIGRSGQLLDKMLAAIGLDRIAEDPEQAVYITNVLPWRPPQNRDPLADEKAMMKPFLQRHIELVKPQILLLVGNPASQTLLDTTQGVTRLRGAWHRVLDIPALAIFHPAYLLRTPIKKREAWADLLMLKAKLNEG